MAKEAASSNERYMANGVSWQRYGHDLACLLKRLDKMDSIIGEQQRLLAHMAMALHDLTHGKPITPQAKPQVQVQGNCRVIQFRQG